MQNPSVNPPTKIKLFGLGLDEVYSKATSLGAYRTEWSAWYIKRVSSDPTYSWRTPGCDNPLGGDMIVVVEEERSEAATIDVFDPPRGSSILNHQQKNKHI